MDVKRPIVERCQNAVLFGEGEESKEKKLKRIERKLARLHSAYGVGYTVCSTHWIPYTATMVKSGREKKEPIAFRLRTLKWSRPNNLAA